LIGIYNDSFISFLENNLGADTVKVKHNNITCRCPYCEIDEDKKHYHLYISLEAPIFHCFHSACTKKSGFVSELVKKITGVDLSDKYIDSDLLNQKKLKSKDKKNLKQLIIPELDEEKFKIKSLYVKKRLGFNIDIQSIKGMIFDIDQFISLNQNEVDFGKTIYKLKDYLQSNFIGFVTENMGVAFFRNTYITSSLKHVKVKLQESEFIDYYKLNGSNFDSNHIVLAEGVFDIWSEYIFNVLNLKNKIKLYASVLSSNYRSLIKSIVYNESIYQLDISILSDRDVPLDYYNKFKKFNNHIINSLTVYYNKGGKDFNDFPLIIEKFII
jgi:hypothetical protein